MNVNIRKYTGSAQKMDKTNQSTGIVQDRLHILVIDDHKLLTETVIAALTAEFGYSVKAVPDVNAGINMIAKHGSFDAILLDYDVPGMNALEGLRRLKEANGDRVALFSGVVNRATVERAIEQGAGGFIAKTLPLRTVGHAIRLIADGEVFLPADFLRQGSETETAKLNLKPREVRVLALLCEGMQNKEIGRELGLDEVIVKMDVKSICRKLDVRNRTQAVITVIKQGLL
jgi:two-component system, NarL family, nitrate/nitrite response regulator NarL